MRHALLALLLIGCNPHDVEITDGAWTAWLGAGSSSTILSSEIKGLDRNSARIYECTGRTYDPAKERFENNYIGPTTAEESAQPDRIGGGCYGAVEVTLDRDGNLQYEEADDGSQRIKWTAREVEGSDPDAPEYYMPEYCGDPTKNTTDDLNTVIQAEVDECAELLISQSWVNKLDDDSYYSLNADMDAWRSEAIMTGEGGLQLTMHQDINGADLHFSFTINPEFAPVRCVSTGDGTAEALPVDDADWLEKWSEDESGYKIYYLNAYGFQDIDPEPDSQVGYSNVTDWSSGYGYANLEGEEFIVDSPTYGDFQLYTGVDIDRDLVADPPAPYDGSDASIQRLYDETIAVTWDLIRGESHDAVEIAGAYEGDIADPSWIYSVKLEDNKWRPIDATRAGFDGWTEVHRSWVRIKNGSKMEKDGQVEGDFQMVLAGRQSGSQFIFHGSFKVDRIREDKWAYDFLEDELRNKEGWGEKFCE